MCLLIFFPFVKVVKLRLEAWAILTQCHTAVLLMFQSEVENTLHQPRLHMLTDFRKVLELPSFKNLTRTSDNAVKPVVIVTVDGGADENPRYEKVIAAAVKHFRQNNLDAIFYATNAPGRSAFNRVERRMAPLSHQLAGVVLPHDTFGSHLNASRKTTDVDLEMRNFAAAGEVLASIWNSTVIDGEEVVSVYVAPSESTLDDSPIVPEDWYENHVRESQYFLQIVKCGDLKCCSKLRSGIGAVLPTGFFPPPCLIEQREDSVKAPIPCANPSKDAQFCSLFVRLALKIPLPYEGRHLPYDLYCPSILQSVTLNRTCPTCGLYFASEKNLRAHRMRRHKTILPPTSARVRPVQVVGRRAGELLCTLDCDSNGSANIVEWLCEEDVDVENVVNNDGIDADAIPLPVVTNLKEWITSPWSVEN